MNTAILTRKVIHPGRWIFVAFIAIALISLLWCLQQRRFSWGPPTTPLEQVLWTSDPSYQTFYGPGTPQSLALAKRINSLKDKGYLPNEILFPNVPVYVAPFVSDSLSSPEDPEIIVNFQLPMAKQLRDSHKHK